MSDFDTKNERAITNYQTSDGVEIFARYWPVDGARGNVVIIHGIGDHGERFGNIVRGLHRAKFQVFAPDMRGHGRSHGPRGFTPSFDLILDDIELAISKANAVFENPGVPVFLYGQSLGGSYVINYVLRRNPEIAGAVASSPLLRLAFEPPNWKLLIGKTIGRFWPTFSIPTGLDLNALSRDPNVSEAARLDSLRHNKVTANLGFSMLEAGAWAIEHAASLRLPLLLMHGKADTITSCVASREFAALAGEHCELKLWPDARHELHNETVKDDVIDCVVEWLDCVVASHNK